MRFRRALDRDVAEGLSAASEPQFVDVAEALELALLLAGGDAARYEAHVLRWHTRFTQEAPNVDLRRGQAVLVATLPAGRDTFGRRQADAARLLGAG